MVQKMQGVARLIGCTTKLVGPKKQTPLKLLHILYSKKQVVSVDELLGVKLYCSSMVMQWISENDTAFKTHPNNDLYLIHPTKGVFFCI